MNLGDILTGSARVHPDTTALVWDEGGGRRTYRELNLRADALASALASGLGLQRGDRVALMMYNGPTLLEAMFGAWKAGATVVPLASTTVLKASPCKAVSPAAPLPST